jgi:crotonobetainyl-CoA:carnitine CoA-transferase CaiB-like acyl-CoA transferase
MFECALSTLNILATMHLYTGLPESGFTYKADLPNYNIYECQDGRFLAVASLEPQFWETFCQIIGRPEWKRTHPDGSDPAIRNEIAEIIGKKTLAQWLEIFDGTHCCVSPVHSLEEALAYLPAKERGVITHIVHPLLGKVPQMATPVSAKSTTADAEGLTADPAQETARALRKLGYSRAEIRELSVQQVIPTQEN